MVRILKSPREFHAQKLAAVLEKMVNEKLDDLEPADAQLIKEALARRLTVCCTENRARTGRKLH